MMPMLRKPSLKQHILMLAMFAITLAWLAAAAFTYVDAKRELNEMLDAHLAQASTLLVAQATHELEEIETEQTQLPHKYSLRVAFQLWQDGTRLRLRSANAPTEPLTSVQSGFSDVVINKQHWRVYSTWDNSHSILIHVAEQSQVRNKLARSIAANLLHPLWLALPLIAILLWWAVTYGLHPLTRLTAEVAKLAPDNLTALDISAAPREVLPLMARLNHLFLRIATTRENERRFTADAAHELRTPIAAIRAQAQVAIGATTEASRTHALNGAITGCDRASHLIEQLLTLARLERVISDTLEPCFLRNSAAGIMAEMAPAALNRNIQLELAEGPDSLIQGLPALLDVLLRNLLANAIHHTPAGSMVRVAVSSTSEQASITVSDNGPGLPPDELEKISQRFYRPPGTNASGSGLGLSIARRIAELHGASLSFSHNESNSGLKVTVNFPHAVQ